MTIKQQGGIFGRNPTFNNVTVDGQTTFNSNITVQNDTAPKISILDSNNGFAAATFTSENGGRDLAIFAPQDIIFDQSGLETARFLDGGGLTFNGDTAAANALDDYEEGSFSPTLTTSGTDFSSVTYDAGVFGSYTKVGNVVHIQLLMLTDAVTKGSASGNVIIGGLPFTANGTSPLAVATSKDWLANHPTRAYVANGATTISLLTNANNTADDSNVVVADVKTLANDNTLRLSGTYRAS